MKYLRKSFSVPVSEGCSQEWWDAIFGKKPTKKKFVPIGLGEHPGNTELVDDDEVEETKTID